jgi:REP element-mobilizing transposase RayT
VGQTPRDTTPGIHHVIVGATGKEAYYLEDPDRLAWVRRFVRTLDRFDWTCIALCQLTTHVHAIVDIPDESISRGMHYLNSFYGKFFNETNERRGSLIRSRYWSKRIVDDEQLLAAYRYVVRNPVRAGICARAEQWFWSSFATSCGLAETFSFIDASVVIATLGATPATARHELIALARADDAYELR